MLFEYEKRKISIEDSTVDLSKMRTVLKAYDALMEELEDVQETEGELEEVGVHLRALEEILAGAKKPKLNCSDVTVEDLHDLGVADRVLHFKKQKITDFVINRMKDSQFKAVCDAMSQEMEDIYQHVNMGYEAGARMLLNTVLKALWKITEQPQAAGEKDATLVSVLPRLKTLKRGIRIANPTTGRELRLAGSVDYYVMRYPDVCDNRGHILSLCSGMTGGVLQFILKLADEQMFLVEAKRHVDGGPLLGSVPEAVSQAIVLGEFLKREEMRFILADGESWKFCILRKNKGRWTYYESVRVELPKNSIAETAPRILALTSEWLHPTVEAESLYRLSDDE